MFYHPITDLDVEPDYLHQDYDASYVDDSDLSEEEYYKKYY